MDKALRTVRTAAGPRDGLELLLFVLFIIVPLAVSGFAPPASPDQGHLQIYSQSGFVLGISRSLLFGVVSGMLLWRHGWAGNLPATRQMRLATQLLAGVGLWFAYYLFFDFWGVVAGLAHIRTGSVAWLHPDTGQEAAMNAAFSVINGFSEEIMRVYLLSQFQRIGAKGGVAAIAVAALMASYHFYQGAFTVLAFFLCNIFLNRFYLSTRALPALITWHILSDFMHSTDLVGWEFVSRMVNGAICVAVLAVSRLFPH